MYTFDVNRAAERAWQFCGQESFNNSTRKESVRAQMAAGKDIHYCYKGQCVGVLHRVWSAIGLNIPGMNHCGNPGAYMNLLNAHPEYYKRTDTSIINSPRYGDVCLYHGGKTVGHGCIYLPIKGQGRWVSDCVQNSWACYTKYWDLQCFRFAGSVNGDGGNAQFPGAGQQQQAAGNVSVNGGSGDMPRWQKCVVDMGEWYEANIHNYSQGVGKYKGIQAFTDCPLVGGRVRHDCSGFVSACLVFYGAKVYDPGNNGWPPASRNMLPDDGNFAKTVTGAGFTKMSYSKESLQAYDVVAGNGHTEIYAGQIGGKDKAYGWGSCHDAAHGGMPCYFNPKCGNGNPYEVIYRCNGTGGSIGAGGGGGGISATPEQMIDALKEKCPKDLEFKGLWMRYHLHAGPHSYILGGMMGGSGSYAGEAMTFSGSADFNNVSSEIMKYIQDAVNSGMAPNSQRWSFDHYRDNVMTFLSTMQSYGLSPFAAICVAGAAATEAGFSGNFRAEPTELAKKGITYAGEGIFGFTGWNTKRKLIESTGVNLPTTESAYAAGPHISDLSWADQCKLGAQYCKDSKYFKYFQPGANPSDTLCAAFLFKAGNWLNSGNLWADVKDAVGRYKSTHARYGYKVRDGFAEMSNIAIKIANATSK